jgi:hypothetical protein
LPNPKKDISGLLSTTICSAVQKKKGGKGTSRLAPSISTFIPSFVVFFPQLIPPASHSDSSGKYVFLMDDVDTDFML